MTNLKKHQIVSGLFFITVLLGPFFACCFASVKEEILKDFRPISASVHKGENSLWILDKGEEAGVSKGDLFSLLVSSEPIYKKKTKKIIGYRPKIVAKCQVVEVLEKSSLCKSYDNRLTINITPLEAIRYNGLKAALFIEKTLVAPTLPGISLGEILPNLNWLEPSKKPYPVVSKSSMEAFGIDLIFQLKDDRITVYGPGLRILKQYQYRSKTASMPFTKKEKGRHPLKQNYLKPIFDFSKAKIVGSLNGKVLQMVVTDLDGNGEKEVIYLLKDKILIAPFKRSGEVFIYKIPDFETPCSFSIGSYNGFFALNSIIDSAGLDSRLFKFKKDALVLIQDEINLWLSFIKSDCSSTKPKLLGQSFERQRLRGEEFFELIPTDSGIIYEDKINFPSDFSIQSVEPLILPNGVCGMYYVSFDGFLKCYAKGHHIWTSLGPIAGKLGICGPQKTDLFHFKNFVIFSNSNIKETKGKGGLFLINLKEGLDPMRIDLNLNGTICGISLIDDYILICVVTNFKGAYKSILYQFDKEKILSQLEQH